MCCVYGEAADDPHRRQQESELQDKSFDHSGIAAETGMTNKTLKVEVLVNHNKGSVAAVSGPKDVTEHMVRVVCDRLETRKFGVCSPQLSK